MGGAELDASRGALLLDSAARFDGQVVEHPAGLADGLPRFWLVNEDEHGFSERGGLVPGWGGRRGTMVAARRTPTWWRCTAPIARHRYKPIGPSPCFQESTTGLWMTASPSLGLGCTGRPRTRAHRRRLRPGQRRLGDQAAASAGSRRRAQPTRAGTCRKQPRCPAGTSACPISSTGTLCRAGCGRSFSSRQGEIAHLRHCVMRKLPQANAGEKAAS